MSSYEHDATSAVRFVEAEQARLGFKAPVIEIRWVQSREPVLFSPPPVVFIEEGVLYVDLFLQYILPEKKRRAERPISLVIEEADGTQELLGPFPASRLDGLVRPHLSSLQAVNEELIRENGDAIRELTEEEFKAEVSECLGRHLLETLISQRAGSWLQEDSLIARIVRGGIEKYFYHLFVPADSISTDVWLRYQDDPGATRWLIQHAGQALVTPFLLESGVGGLQWLVANRPSGNQPDTLSNLPSYLKGAPEHLLDELEAKLK